MRFFPQNLTKNPLLEEASSVLLENFLSVFSFRRSWFFLSQLTTNWSFFFVWFCSEPFSFLFFSWCEASSCFCCFRIWFDHFYLRERILFSFFVFFFKQSEDKGGKFFEWFWSNNFSASSKSFAFFFRLKKEAFVIVDGPRFNKCRVGERAKDKQNVNEVLHHQSSLHSLMLENYRHVFCPLVVEQWIQWWCGIDHFVQLLLRFFLILLQRLLFG